MASGMEAETGSVGRRKSSSRGKHSKQGGSPSKVPIVVEDHYTFKDLQKHRIKVMEKRVDEEMKKKRKDFDTEVDKMKLDFLTLYAEDKDWGSEELLTDPMVLRRQGSMDILDQKNMTTVMSEFFETSGSRFRLMFDVSEFDQDSVHVQIQSDLVSVLASKTIESEEGLQIKKEFGRKIQRPIEISATRFETSLTKDGILVVEAPMPSTHHIKIAPNSSPSHSVTSNASTRSQSPTSPQTPTGQPKIGMPMFTGKPGDRRMSLIVELGDVFKPQDILVAVCNSTTLEVKAKTESRNTERMSKNKFFKLIELGEKIISTSLRAGLMDDGKLVIGAIGKPEKGPDGKPIHVPVEEGQSESVVDLASDFSRVMHPEPPPKPDEL